MHAYIHTYIHTYIQWCTILLLQLGRAHKFWKLVSHICWSAVRIFLSSVWRLELWSDFHFLENLCNVTEIHIHAANVYVHNGCTRQSSTSQHPLSKTSGCLSIPEYSLLLGTKAPCNRMGSQQFSAKYSVSIFRSRNASETEVECSSDLSVFRSSHDSKIFELFMNVLARADNWFPS